MAGKSGRTISNVPEKSWKKMILGWEGILILLFLAINVYCMMLSPNYKLANVLREMPKYLTEVFLLLPMVYILIMGEIDISVGANVCLSATMACILSNAGAPFPLVLLAGVATGLACGIFNGILVASFTELPPMIVTLADMIIFRGIAEIVLGSGGSVSLKDASGFRLLAGKIGKVPYILPVVLVCALIFGMVLAKTSFGRQLYAIGSNKTTAFYSGVHVQRVRMIVYGLAGLMAGISAMFLVSVLYGANTTTGNGFELDAIAMAVFGGVSTAGGKGKMGGAILSALTIICLRIGLGQVNINPQVILIILGALLVIAVVLPEIVKRFKTRKALGL